MKKKVHPVVAVLLAVIVVAALSLIGYQVFSTTSAVALPTANVRPANPADPKYTPKLPAGVGGSASGS